MVESDVYEAVRALEARLDRQAAELEGLRAELRAARMGATAARAQQYEVLDATVSRRRLLRGAGVAGLATAAGAATVLASASPAAAANGDPVAAGQTVDATAPTYLRASAAATQGVLVAHDNASNAGSVFPAAVSGWAYGAAVSNGVYGWSDSRSPSDTTTGHGVVARITANGRSNLVMPPGRSSSPAGDAFAHRTGELVTDSSGNLWYCHTTGTPGGWRKISGPASGGTFHPITPARAYDSRLPMAPVADGILSQGQVRVVPLKDGRDVNTGAVAKAEVVPAGATAVAYNIAVVGMVGPGWLQVSPGDDAALVASSINWAAETTGALSNAGIVALDSNRQVAVLAGGTTQFLIDVTGYWL